MPKQMKKKGTIPAANASMDRLSITFSQLQIYPIVEIDIHTLQTVCRGHPDVLIHSLFHQVIVHAQGMLHINLVHNRCHNHSAAFQQFLGIIHSEVLYNGIDLIQYFTLNPFHVCSRCHIMIVYARGETTSLLYSNGDNRCASSCEI